MAEVDFNQLPEHEARELLLTWRKNDERRGPDAVELGARLLNSDPNAFGDKRMFMCSSSDLRLRWPLLLLAPPARNICSEQRTFLSTSPLSITLVFPLGTRLLNSDPNASGGKRMSAATFRHLACVNIVCWRSAHFLVLTNVRKHPHIRAFSRPHIQRTYAEMHVCSQLRTTLYAPIHKLSTSNCQCAHAHMQVAFRSDCTLAHVPTETHARIRTSSPTHIPLFICLHKRECAGAHTRVCTRACLLTHSPSSTYTDVRAHAHTHTLVHLPAQAHTLTHIYPHFSRQCGTCTSTWRSPRWTAQRQISQR